jgi:hypothetical protein
MEELLASSLRIEKKLDDGASLLGFLVSETQDGLAGKAVVLNRLGIGRTQIADICGTTALTISVRLAEAKKRAKTGPKKRK